MIKKEYLKAVSMLFLAWILVRSIVYFFFDFSQPFSSGDSIYYFEVAKNIISSGTHYDSASHFTRAPLYPFFLSLILYFSDSPLFLFIAQSLIYFPIPIAIYFFLKESNPKMAFICALIVSISPFDAIYNGRALAETLVSLFLCLGTILFVSKKWFISGLVLGAAALTRDIYLLLPFLFLLFSIFNSEERKGLIIFSLGFLLMISPWMLRNSAQDQGGFFISSGGIFWLNLFVGTYMTSEKDDVMPVNNPDYIPDKIFKIHNLEMSEDDLKDKFLNAESNQSFFKQQTISYIKEHPIDLLTTWLKRMPKMWMGTRTDLVKWKLERESLAWTVLKGSFYILNTILLVFFILGLYLSVYRYKHLLLLATPIIYNAFIYLPFYNIETRYSQPIYPLLLIFSAFGLIYLSDLFRKRSTF
ncbi:MAG: ArnT family glycosyltransferase [Gammaproteobacteria bacterium]